MKANDGGRDGPKGTSSGTEPADGVVASLAASPAASTTPCGARPRGTRPPGLGRAHAALTRPLPPVLPLLAGVRRHLLRRGLPPRSAARLTSPRRSSFLLPPRPPPRRLRLLRRCVGGRRGGLLANGGSSRRQAGLWRRGSRSHNRTPSHSYRPPVTTTIGGCANDFQTQKDRHTSAQAIATRWGAAAL